MSSSSSSSSSASTPSTGGSGRSSQQKEADARRLQEAQKEMRRQIMQIQNDPTLSPADKSRAVQELMSRRYRESSASARDKAVARMSGPESLRAQSPTHSRRSGAAATSNGAGNGNSGSNTSNAGGTPEDNYEPPVVNPEDIYDGFATEEEAAKVVTWHNQELGLLGCPHYQRGCKVLAPCCNKWYTCRQCHDLLEDHLMDRTAVEKMMCMHCKATGVPAQSCGSCARMLARYWCNRCNLWSDADLNVFHCDKCNICRLGRPDEFFHCDTCGVCMDKSAVDNHRCIERNLYSDCPICGDFLFTSTAPVIFMRCGHAIHRKCLDLHVETSYQCPTCMKSLADMTTYFQQIEKLLQSQPMPAEYADNVALILCNDCEVKGHAKYHFMYLKCRICKGYNTRELSVHKEVAPNSCDDDGCHYCSPSASAEVDVRN